MSHRADVGARSICFSLPTPPLSTGKRCFCPLWGSIWRNVEPAAGGGGYLWAPSFSACIPIKVLCYSAAGHLPVFCLVCPCGRSDLNAPRIPSSRQRVFLHSRLQSARETRVQGESGSAHSALIASDCFCVPAEGSNRRMFVLNAAYAAGAAEKWWLLINKLLQAAKQQNLHCRF